MALPKISHPMFDVIIPSTKKKVKIRPMLVKEEKILLMAKTTDDNNAVLSAVKQVVNNCIVDGDIDVDRLSTFDVEFLFVRIRAISVSNISKVSYRDNADQKIYDFEVDLDKVEVIFPDKVEKTIKISDSTGITMKYPEAAIYSDEEFLDSAPEDFVDNLILRCIDKVYDGDEMYDVKMFSKKDIQEFVDQLEINVYDKMREFFTNLPKLHYKIEYKNAKGNDREIILSSLNDFFTLR